MVRSRRRVLVIEDDPAIHRYAADGSAEEAFLWIEGDDTLRISYQPGEVFTLTLARDVGARLRPLG
jgi:hypothetical protein